MLWMKYWMETRMRFLFAILVFTILAMASMAQFNSTEKANSLPAGQRLAGALAVFSLFFVMQAVTLAGAGIKTQAPFQIGRGLHGSMHYTLSLPVSRLRLLATRVGLGLLELAGAILAASVIMLFLLRGQFPDQRVLLLDWTRYAFTLCMCLTACFALSTLFATFMDDAWQMWGSLIAIGALRGLAQLVSLPENLDPFRVISSTSPFVTHAVPWGAIAICLAMTGVLSMGTIKIVQTRDY
jgi:hypothetical protein